MFRPGCTTPFLIASFLLAGPAFAQGKGEVIEQCRQAVIAKGYDGFDPKIDVSGPDSRMSVRGTAVGSGNRVAYTCTMDRGRVRNVAITPYHRDRDRDDDRPGNLPRSVHCESHDKKMNECRIDTRNGVRLVDQTSDTRCRKGDNWDTKRGRVWVDKGCSAKFEARGR